MSADRAARDTQEPLSAFVCVSRRSRLADSTDDDDGASDTDPVHCQCSQTLAKIVEDAGSWPHRSAPVLLNIDRPPGSGSHFDEPIPDLEPDLRPKAVHVPAPRSE